MEDDARPLVSVIVPVYNTARYLPQCLSSLCAQTLHAIEILCINDGSTDASEDIIREFCARDARVRLISQPNAGAYTARKNGMRRARGEYIGFVDSDDHVDPDFYELLYAAARREQAELAATTAILPFHDAGELLPPKPSPIAADTPSLSAEQRARFFLSTASACNKLYKKSLCMSLIPLCTAKENRAEDNTITIPALILANKVTVITRPRYFYRQHAHSNCQKRLDIPSLLNIYDMYCRILHTAREISAASDYPIYRKAILRRRNWECFQLSEKLPGLSEQLAFVWRTRDAGFQLSWLARKLRSLWRGMTQRRR